MAGRSHVAAGSAAQEYRRLGAELVAIGLLGQKL